MGVEIMTKSQKLQTIAEKIINELGEKVPMGMILKPLLISQVNNIDEEKAEEIIEFLKLIVSEVETDNKGVVENA
jgi:hypothetical protein